MNRHDYRIARLHAGKERAALARHRGEPGKQHASWERKPIPRSEQPEPDCFDIWLASVEQRVKEIKAEYVPPHVQAARDDFADEIPF
jgi:hypothetical protein